MTQNKKILKNTLFLYIRMLLIMGVSLYTSRIVLKELGVSDFGIYTVVGGFISLFAFLNSAMTAATQRYITIDLGKKDFQALQKTFSATLTIHFMIGFLVLILAETIGLWYVNYKMVFPDDRIMAVNVVYQFSVATTILGIIQIPYNSLLIAHEKMNIYAYVGIAEAILKLSIVFLLVYFGNDKLITYAILTFVVALGIRLFYQFYCRKNYAESIYHFEWNAAYIKELFIYSGWNLFGNLAVVVKGQGSNLILNFFYGTTVNAAFGIMTTVNSAVNSFINNFQIASNPQIVKLYANDQKKEMEKLIFQTSKFSFFLSLVMIAPIYFNMDFLLKIWLVDVPRYTAEFSKMILLVLLVETISKPIMTGINATGKIKIYHLALGLMNLLIIPITLVMMKIDLIKDPSNILLIWLIFSVLSLFARIGFAKSTMQLNLKSFFKKVMIPICLVFSVSFFIGFQIDKYFPVNSILLLVINLILITIINIIFMLLLGVNKIERSVLTQLLKKTIF